MSINHKSVLIKPKTSNLTQKEVEKTVYSSINKIRAAFSKKEINQIAWETGFIKRISSRLQGKDFIVTLLVASLDSSHSSLEKISSILSQVNRDVRITAQSLMERINSPATADFCLRIQEHILNKRISELRKSIPIQCFNCFSKVFIQDSTVFELHEDLQKHFKGSGGRSSKSAIKIDVIYEILEKQYAKFTVTDQKKTDSSLASEIDSLLIENSLVIRDLGYLRIDGLTTIIQKLGYFLSRLKSNFSIFLDPDSEAPAEIADCFGDDDAMIDMPIYITEKRLAVRLIAYRAPENVINERKRLAHATAKKQGRTVGEKALKLMEFTIFITNVSPTTWPPEVVGTIYSVRWQIEILFKNWKTGMGIHYIKGINENRIRTLIYIRLLLMIIINEVYKLASGLGEAVEKTVSMCKVFAWMRDSARLRKLLKSSTKPWESRFYLDTVLKSMCQQKRKRKHTLQAIIESISYEEYCA
jgi:hypothetical protein